MTDGSFRQGDAHMPYGLYLSAEGAQVQSRRMETIANNLANVDTPGFKRDVTTFQARLAEAIEQGRSAAGSGAIDDVGGGVMVTSTRTDFSPGTMERTGIPTDLAIEGEGFFALRHPNGTYLTRAGNFRLTPDGRLVSRDGHTVLSETGEPVVVDPSLGEWRVMGDGGVFQAGDIGQRLALVRPATLRDLAKVGDNLFRPLAATAAVPGAQRQVRQGYLEGSAVNPTYEMMELIETSRAFEANTRLIQHQDHMIGSLISRLLDG
jgi:flagellar basal-body rod protein FlgF